MSSPSTQLNADLDPSLPRELEGVAGEIHQALRDAPVVAVGDRKAVGYVDHEFQPFLGGERAQRNVDDVDDLARRILRQRELHAPGLDLGEVEDVVDQAQQVAPVHLDVGERLLQVRRNVAIEPVEQHLGEPENRVHRRAQLVAHVGEEFRLRLARLRQLLVEAAELGRGAALLGVEPVELLAHVVHPVRQDAEFVAIGDADAAAEVSRRHLVEKAVRLANREDERPRDHESAEQREQHRADRERAGQDQRPAIGGVDAVAQPRHPLLLLPRRAGRPAP